MKQKDKIEEYKTKQFSKWYYTRREVEQKLSDEQTMFCCCGKLATGLHETHCKKFQHKVDVETIKRLEHETT